jgi:hypothetical protein
MQTIAHNTLVVDETTQNSANFDAAEKMSGQRHWFDARNANAQGMSARADNYYPGVSMQRTMLLLRDARLRYPVVIDLYRAVSEQPHSYDYPIHFRGQLITTNAKYQADTLQRVPLGKAFGYEHIWKEASATADSSISLTWLDGARFYTLTTSAAPASQLILGRTGARDPQFNLMVEPLALIRRRGSTELFAAVIEPHGFFSEVQERSEQARGKIKAVRTIGHNAAASVIEITGDDGIRWIVMASNGAASESAQHRVTFAGKTYEWTGNFAVEGLKNAN